MKLKHTLLAAALIGAGAFAFAAPASAADNCKDELTGNDLMQYDKKVHLQYTTTSPIMHQRLGVKETPPAG